MPNVAVAIPGRDYHIAIGAGLLDAAAADACKTVAAERSCLIVTDTTVGPLYGAATRELLRAAGARQVTEVSFAAGEPSKNLATVADLYEAAVTAGIDRKSLVVALGGGVVGDTAGFVAATYMRGIDLLQVPTTLLAQVDSSVGGKTGVDLPCGKNLVGAFLQPRAVIVDVGTLRSLPPRQLRCGLAEVIKYGVILDPALFTFVEQHLPALLDFDARVYEHVITRCCELKAEIVVADEFETGQRAILNYGHTFGHAIEHLTGYQKLTHGEAIAVGMCMAADLAMRLAPTPARDELVTRQTALFEAVGLPTRSDGLQPSAILAAMRSDKKFVSGRNRLIVPAAIGQVEILEAVAEPLILEAIRGRCD